MAIILALDDVSDASILMKRILERKGHQVHAFTEEEDALAFARDEKPDLAILDIKLKRLTGVEVLEELRKISPGTRVIMLTGYPTLETARHAKALGATDYLVKPIDKDELEARVAAALDMG